MSDFKFQENIIITGKIICDTGLHIGESNDSLEIGGIDLMVMRDKGSDLPYIPGSSLKGKLRSLLELYDAESVDNIIENAKKSNKDEFEPCQCGRCTPCKIFGFSNKDPDVYNGPTRIIVRDSFHDKDTKKFWKDTDDIVRGTEIKTENTIDRVKGAAKNPRPSERVPKGSKFNFEIVFSIYCDEDKKNLKELFTSMKLLEDNYLGGSGSRGYGKVHFEDLKCSQLKRDYYTNNDTENSNYGFETLSELNFNELESEFGWK